MKIPTFIIMGPTGVGKSDFAETLARRIGGEIINCDVGQFYTPLSIGTAKPDWQRSDIPHHMFDIINEPRSYSVTEYRAQVTTLLQEISGRGKVPIIVGGSGFYVNALFFPPQDMLHHTSYEKRKDTSWDALFRIDPERAQKIHPHDSYRIERALQLWDMTGVLPSQQKPVYQAVSDNFYLVHITRERDDLYARINARTLQMLVGVEAGSDEYIPLELENCRGWLGEVQGLSAAWRDFLLKKGLIGYPEIIEYLQEEGHYSSAESSRVRKLISSIQKSTRNYAKRQITFWRMLSHKLQEAGLGERLMEANLTLSPVDLYIRQLQKKREGLL